MKEDKICNRSYKCLFNDDIFNFYTKDGYKFLLNYIRDNIQIEINKFNGNEMLLFNSFLSSGCFIKIYFYDDDPSTFFNEDEYLLDHGKYCYTFSLEHISKEDYFFTPYGEGDCYFVPPKYLNMHFCDKSEEYQFYDIPFPFYMKDISFKFILDLIIYNGGFRHITEKLLIEKELKENNKVKKTKKRL